MDESDSYAQIALYTFILYLNVTDCYMPMIIMTETTFSDFYILLMTKGNIDLSHELNSLYVLLGWTHMRNVWSAFFWYSRFTSFYFLEIITV